MKTLGVDLASQAERTAICVVEWGQCGAALVEVRVGVDDDQLVNAHDQVDVTGIDCPFGWPEPFCALLAGPEGLAPWNTDLRDKLRFRRTDFRVRRETGRWPLSVSSDLIAVPAMRCQFLLQRMGVADLSGNGRVFEVYPAGSLAVWGFASQAYKRRAGRSLLRSLLNEVRERLPWLRLGGQEEQGLLEASDDAFDALVAALTARAAWLGLTVRPSPEEQAIAEREGWIALPLPGSLVQLLSNPVSG